MDIKGGNRVGPRGVKSADQFEPVPPRVWSDTCVRCRKRFARGDRVLPVMIVAGVGVDAESMRETAVAGAFYEISHLDCTDPQLLGTVVVLASKP